MTVEQASSTTPHASVEPLEEIARRLARVHMSLATNLDGGSELQSWTLGQLEDLMAYVDSEIDSQAATKSQVGGSTSNTGSTRKSQPRTMGRESRA